ncbi:NHL repeat-containing protein [Granulicella pectinivorans]|uniref:NHL repeat-containing protein n=1 Tax=Granulicella pectinivorans TaxID=474950 RepID=A0A1I6MT81_9BACT|nr:NHL repeat-containing protein [Granulicella pectinivorans]
MNATKPTVAQRVRKAKMLDTFYKMKQQGDGAGEPIRLPSFSVNSVKALSIEYFAIKSFVLNTLRLCSKLKSFLSNGLGKKCGRGWAAAQSGPLSFASGLTAKLALAAGFIFTFSAAAQTAAQLRALDQLNPANSGLAASGVEATTVPVSVPAGLAYDAVGNLYIAAMNDQVIRKVDLNGIITTVVGTGEQGFGGDGGAALSAQLDSPAGIAIDGSGNLYIADSHNHRIREVVNGVISTIAGTGTAGFSGDGAAATSAQLNLPTAVSVDASGNLYIADTNNQRIRKVVAGTITTVAGTGEQIYSGDGGPALLAGLDSPNGVAADTLVAGKFYIGDTHNQRVRQVDASGIISTLAGTGTKAFSGDGSSGVGAGLARPRGLAVDTSGRILIADSDNNRVRLLANGTIATIAGDGEQTFAGDTGLAIDAALDTPRTTAVSNSGLIALTDTNNQRVRGITLSGAIATLAGIAPSSTESLVLSGVTSTVYGSGSLTATFNYGSATATGTVTLLDGTTAAGTATFSSNTATFSLATLTAGQHTLTASYAGDTNNPAIVSGVYLVTVTPLAIVATANPVSILYGQPIPTLTGTLTGVLPADTANVTAVFATTATQGSQTGLYPITVSLTGSAAPNYSVSLVTGGQSGPDGVTIAPASSRTVLTTSNASPAYSVSTTLTATVTASTSGTATGTVQFLNGATVLGTSALNAGGVATLPVSTLPLGVNSVTAVYSGDTNLTTSTSASVTETVTPFALVATANPVSVLYGQPIPALTGTLTGVAQADAANVTAVFATTATQGARSGVYPITVTLTGSAAANYTVSLSGTPAVTIAAAGSRTVLASSNASIVFSTPITLTATVTSLTSGTPTGTVQFLNGTTVLGTVAVNAGGVATLVVSTLPIGVNALTAVYAGDTNFATSASTAIAETVGSSDFSFNLATGGNGTQTVTPGLSATFPFTVAPTLATFPQAVTFTVSGLPPGATYTLSPASIAAGAGSTAMTLTVQTSNLAGKLAPAPMPRRHGWPAVALGLLLLPFGTRRFRRLSRRFSRRGLMLVWMVFGLAAAGALSGCGAGGFFNQQQQSYNIVVTATSGSISHTASVTLTVQ